ncbi:MAG TPA: hypothetical protein VGE66_03720 [Chitinophagaceae bacterium]
MKKIYLALYAALFNVVAWAQEGGADVSVDIDKGGDAAAGGIPWMWIIGAVVLILLIVAFSGGGRRRRVSTGDGDVTVTKTTTVRRETDVDPDAI